MDERIARLLTELQKHWILKRFLRNILYVLLITVSVSVIASTGNGFRMTEWAMDAMRMSSASVVPEDSLPKQKVRKTDYTRDERPEKYAFDLADRKSVV